MGNTAYSYESVGNLTLVHYPSSPNVTMTYDALNRMTNMVDAVGTTAYTYTPAGQLRTENGPFASDTITNTYWNRLRVEMDLQQPTGLWTNKFGYDYSRRLAGVVSPAGEFDYEYLDSLPSTLVQKLSLPNTSYITNAYDGNARLLNTGLRNSSDSILNYHAYLYNQASERTAQSYGYSTGDYDYYYYDRIGQLLIATNTLAVGNNRKYGYDAAWNVAAVTNNTTPNLFTVDTDNQLVTDPNFEDYYDANGNLQWQVYGDPWWYGDSEWEYNFVYDDENRLVSVKFYDYYQNYLPMTQTDFAYDGLGRLRERTEWTYNSDYEELQVSSVTEYIYDGKRVIQERDGGNNPTVSYTRGSDLSGSLEGAGGIGGMLARSDNYSSGNWTRHNYYHADGNGNITYLVNSSQTLAASYRYDPFGNTISSSGTLASANTYRFSSKEWVNSVGLYYYLYRFYDPNLQRWLNRDPLMDAGSTVYDRMTKPSSLGTFRRDQREPNGYEFVNNDSVTRSDAFGLEIWTPPSNINAPPSSCSPPPTPPTPSTCPSKNPCPPGQSMKPDPDCVRDCNLDFLHVSGGIALGGGLVFIGAAADRSLVGACTAAAGTVVGMDFEAWWRDHICIPKCPKKCQ